MKHPIARTILDFADGIEHFTGDVPVTITLPLGVWKALDRECDTTGKMPVGSLEDVPLGQTPVIHLGTKSGKVVSVAPDLRVRVTTSAKTGGET